MLHIRGWFLLLMTFAGLALPPGLCAQMFSTGYIDPAFLAPCLSNVPNVSTRALAVLPDGKILAGGDFTVAGGACFNGLARLHTNGATDASFPALFVPGSSINAMTLLPSGKTLVAGIMSTDGGAIFPVARLNTNGSLDQTFAHINYGSSIVVHSLAVQPDG